MCNIASMPRGSRTQPAESASTDDARERILTAAERCIDRHGIRKTTMDDIASEVGLSRPSVYRYFADRDDLLIELNIRHARALLDRAHKAMSRQTNFPDQIIEGILYMASDVGAVTAIDAATGRRIWQQRVEGIFSASPVAADGKVYFVSETGETIVLKAGRQAEVLARNDVGERLIASPAISNGQIFLRSDDRLFAIGKR